MAESGNPLEQIERLYDQLPGWIVRQPDETSGAVVIKLLELSDRSEAMAAGPLRRFEKSRAWAAEGALNVVAWLHSHGKLSGGAAMQRVAIARQLEQLPGTEKALQRVTLASSTWPS